MLTPSQVALLNYFLSSLANFIILSAKLLGLFLQVKYIFINGQCFLQTKPPLQTDSILAVHLQPMVKFPIFLKGVKIMYKDLLSIMALDNIELCQEQQLFIDIADLVGLCRILQNKYRLNTEI
jgi:hypothetical protein